MPEVANRQQIPLGSSIKSSRSASWASVAPFVAILAFYVLCVAFVSPAGNFPLNDDWMYSYAVQCFLESGKFVFVGPNCTSCLLHIIAGAALCKLVGFSHVALRCFTLTLALGSTAVLYGILRELRVGRKLATLAALTYAANPVFMNIAFSYMTDIASLFLTSVSSLLTIQGIKRSSAWRFIVAGVFLLAAIAVRQTNIVFAAASACVLLYYWWRKRPSWGMLLFLVVLPTIWFKVVDKVVPVSSNHPYAYRWYQNSINGIFHGLLKTPLNELFYLDCHFGEMCFYLTLLILPLVIAFVPCFKDLFRRAVQIPAAWFVLAVGTVVATLTKFVVLDHSLMPFSQNLLRIPVLGTLSLLGINLPRLHHTWGLALTHACAIGSVLLIAVLLAGFQRIVARAYKLVRNAKLGLVIEKQTLAQIFIFASTAGMLALCVMQASINDLDRYYLIPSIWLISGLCVVARWLRVRPNIKILSIALALMATYSVCAEQDYMSWNRARWAAAAWLESTGVRPAEIDGGAEYNFVHNHELYNTRYAGAEPLCHWRWWHITGEKYLVSFSPVSGYVQIASQHYWSALTPFKKRELLILKHEQL